VYAVPIRPFLAGQAFEPELIEQMSAALVKACEAMQLSVMDDPATRLVARTIIELAQRGFRDAESLVEMTLREFGADHGRGSGQIGDATGSTDTRGLPKGPSG
jgi:hypothetical protein